jgi:hypothetical protein
VITPPTTSMSFVGRIPVINNPNWIPVNDSQTTNWVPVAA